MGQRAKVCYSDYPAFQIKHIEEFWWHPMKHVQFLITNNIQPLGYHPSGTYYRYLKNMDFVPYVRISKLYYYIWVISSNTIVPHLDCWDRNLPWRGKWLLKFTSWILEIPAFFNYAENHVQNPKSRWKSYAVFLAIIWLLKIETFTKLAFILLTSLWSQYLFGSATLTLLSRIQT